MAESSPGLTYAKLSGCKPAHPRRNLFGGLGRAGQPPVSPRLCRPLGRRHDLILRWPALPRGWPGESTGHVNPKYGSEPGRLFYTHISDQYAPFSTRSECRRPRFHLCARRPAVPRVRPADRGALHRHGRLHRSRLCPDAPARLPLRAAHPRPRRNQAVRAAGRASLPDVAPADRRHPEHQARAPTGTTSCARQLDRGTVTAR
ncbi:Putative transposase (identified by ISEscan HMM) [Klebsiella pneumoniae]|nr:Putative transposase (identified by ISEscan HMM) [Klebsiella pneumoniae]